MSTGYWQRTITNDAGDIIANATIEVREPSADFTGSLVSLVDIDGAGLSNPFNADSEGFARFGTDPQLVDIRATGSGSQRTWRRVDVLGTAATRDHGTATDEVPLNSDLGTAAVADTLDFRENTTMSASDTLPIPTAYGTQYVTYDAATGTLTLPPLSSVPEGGMIVVSKDNAAQGAVDINPDGTDSVQWGTAQLRLYADGNKWAIRRGNARWELVFGSETGSNSNGEWEKLAFGRMTCKKKGLTGATSDIVWGSSNLFRSSSSGAVTWTFPQEFVDSGTTACFAANADFAAIPIARDRGDGLTNESFGLISDNINDNYPFNVMAVGEWYAAA